MVTHVLRASSHRGRVAALLCALAFLLQLLRVSVADVDASVGGESPPPLALDASDGAPGVRRLRFGEKVALDELGPVLVNTDCSLRRIANWHEKLPHEKEATQRRVAKRNAARLEVCRKLEAEGRLPEHAGEYVDDNIPDAQEL